MGGCWGHLGPHRGLSTAGKSLRLEGGWPSSSQGRKLKEEEVGWERLRAGGP